MIRFFGHEIDGLDVMFIIAIIIVVALTSFGVSCLYDQAISREPAAVAKVSSGIVFPPEVVPLLRRIAVGIEQDNKNEKAARQR